MQNLKESPPIRRQTNRKNKLTYLKFISFYFKYIIDDLQTGKLAYSVWICGVRAAATGSKPVGFTTVWVRFPPDPLQIYVTILVGFPQKLKVNLIINPLY